jgi:hypothetical protein
MRPSGPLYAKNVAAPRWGTTTMSDFVNVVAPPREAAYKANTKAV